MINIDTLTIESAHHALKNKDFTVAQLVAAYVKRSQEKNSEINAYVEIYSELKDSIEVAQAKFDNGSATMLTGIPCALKDNMLHLGHSASCGSKILEKYIGAYDSHVTELLKKEGAIIIGRTNMDEFAMGSSTETSYFGLTKNPYDLDRVPGGSSGGAAAAVAMHASLFSLGSDTGGSIRQPAALCNLVGLKPTYGSISRYGLVALASSLDQIGPLTHTVADAEIVFNALAIHDTRDSTSVAPHIRKTHKKPLKKKIGVPYHFFENGGVQPEILDGFKKTLALLESDGYEVVPLSLSYIKYALPVYYIIQPAEASSNLARFDGIRYGARENASSLFNVYAQTRGTGFGKEVRRRILLGTYVLSHGYFDAYYGKALTMKEHIKLELNKVFEEVDVIATPTTANTAFKFGEKSSDPVSMYLEDIFTVPANITGDPAISIPIGFDANNLPFGIQLIAPAFNEEVLFTIGKDIESTVQ
jgi:aspartyl-tRNA(Asn)/glutamyl-tRNA(Gln) amidotransferase subunit A